MIAVKEAKKLIEDNIKVLPPRRVSLSGATNKVLAKAVTSQIEVPSFDNSAMDGYALQLDEFLNSYKITEEIPAGDGRNLSIETGCAARIFTGAVVPANIDTVIPQELVRRKGDYIEFDPEDINRGANIRKQGAQTRKGEVIAESGTLLTPGAIGLLASVGVDEVWIYPPPSVGVLVTGSELVSLGEKLQKGQIYDSNSHVIKAYLQSLTVVDLHTSHSVDNLEALRAKVDQFLNECDILIISGGISVGDYDFVYDCLEEAGVEKLFYKVKQRPGKPFYTGIRNGKFVFALPGNPGSVVSCLNQYIKPCIRSQMGFAKAWEADNILPLSASFPKKKGLTYFVKGQTDGGEVKALSGQQSFNMKAFQEANCFAEMEEGTDMVKDGSPVKIYYW